MSLKQDLNPGVAMDYLNYLYNLVGGNYGPCKNYYYLMSTLLELDYYWVIPNDENRCEDGIELRYSYNQERGVNNELLTNQCCTVLEMMIGLAIRIQNDITYSDDFEDMTSVWFCQMIANLNLLDCTDDLFCDEKREKIVRTIYRFLDREFNFDGYGGLFPLKHPKEDQRNVEIWKQMTGYFAERGY